jgi:oligo-1,6-glucosidase
VYANGPRVHEFLQAMYHEALAPYDVMTVGEGSGIPPHLANLYVGSDRQELNMIFHFGHMGIDHGPGGRFDPQDWTLVEFKRIFREWHEAVGDTGWVNVFLDNHDFPRMVSRFGNDREYRLESAKLLATLLLTLRGTPCIYYGSEIGMANVNLENWDEVRDIEARNAYRAAQEKGEDVNTLLQAVNKNGRDNARTPMQWNASTHAGFTTGTPWLKVNPNYTEVNVEAALQNPNSIFYHYKKLLRLRKANPTLIYGSYEDLYPDDARLYGYRRWDAEGEFYIFLNFSNKAVDHIFLPKDKKVELILSNYDTDPILLKPWEARIYRVKG